MKEYGRLIRSRPTIQHSGVTCLNYTYFNSNKHTCNLIPINKISLFTAFTTWHCCRLHYCLGTFFWNYLYSNQQVWTSTFFLIFSYLVSSLLFHILEQTDRQTDVPTYQTDQTIEWKFNKKKLSIKSLLVVMLFWVSYFCFLQGVSIILLLLGFYFVRLEPSSSDRTEQEKHERKKKYWLWFV